MGEKSFFKNHDKMDAATDGLAYVYLNTDEINEAATSFFQATLNECNRRESFLLLGV